MRVEEIILENGELPLVRAYKELQKQMEVQEFGTFEILSEALHENELLQVLLKHSTSVWDSDKWRYWCMGCGETIGTKTDYQQQVEKHQAKKLKEFLLKSTNFNTQN